jgi:hypothetical protein
METITVLLTRSAGLLSGCKDTLFSSPADIETSDTFTMPHSTEYLIRTLDRQHHEAYELHIREAENHRFEPETLHPGRTG